MVRDTDRVSTPGAAFAAEPVAAAPAAAAAAPPGRAARPDAVLVAAVDLARAAAVEEATEPGARGEARVGEHLGTVAEGERLVVHRFACTDRAYVGWSWTVELARASRGKTATVNDVVLLPGGESLLAPAWVPYEERVRPGDLGVGDLLPTAADDPRLVLTRGDVSDWSDEALWLELGLGRARVLSAEGRDDAAERWWEGEQGPEAAIAKAAPLPCSSCGFLVRLVGGLGRVFGACANALSPDDGQVVAATHGCGAHSEAIVVPPSRWGVQQVDDDGLDLVVHPPGSVSDSTPAEPYGHS